MCAYNGLPIVNEQHDSNRYIYIFPPHTRYIAMGVKVYGVLFSDFTYKATVQLNNNNNNDNVFNNRVQTCW